ncbi:MFS transporter, partial [Francisella tularensis subsp. holarctica]|nr:MFS transporter [Francisella tularensis subsp. holarctica]
NNLGVNMPVTTVMSTQLSLLIIIKPFFGILCQKLGQYKKEPADELKFVFSLIFLALCFYS